MSVAVTPILLIPKKVATKKDIKIQLSSRLLDRLCIEKNSDLRFSIGNQIITVKIDIADVSQNEIHLPEQIFSNFSLPMQTYKFLAKYTIENNCLHLGPVVGLLTDFNTDKEEPNFRTIHLFCEELHQGFSELGGFFYVFSYKDFSDTGANGYHFENGKWVYSELPLPEVIYNRIHSRRLEQVASFKSFRKILEQLNIPFFNDRFLSKWEVYEKLMLEEKIHPYIPETRIFSKENLKELIETYHTIFIKPIHGSQGRNIIKLGKEENHFVFQSTLNIDSDFIIKKESIDEIFHQLKPHLHNRIYIIQQGIPLATHQSRSMDFRVLCHKNKKDLWEVTSLVARISAESQFVSNIARGGEITKPLIALSPLFEKEIAKKIVFMMKELSIEAATIICSQFTGITGELGIDIGVDQDGRVWLIEINSKPSKNFEENTVKIRPSAKAIIQFCTKLALDTPRVKED
ncbi:YheC/YheD family protein [Neobacillus sp. PS3-40]|uniref:YheC/YheD family endospore coat-associated protein n=1 Tax=Neobacillus sp. PS3-40 TaxID=3070679 RepID=UPI0027E04DDE|nr:YheC/YheD family protein [Neobacillus sp. PS3-40]WML43280.1 YheC/YheD family protein [Neobacillus sp. PS3-40]